MSDLTPDEINAAHRILTLEVELREQKEANAKLRQTVANLRKQLQRYQQAEKRRYQQESDYLPYEDDPYDR